MVTTCIKLRYRNIVKNIIDNNLYFEKVFEIKNKIVKKDSNPYER